MFITVFGANGKVGTKVVNLLLEQGHKVRAFVHGPSKLSQHVNLQVINGDIHNKADVEKSLAKADIVISTLGSWGTPTKDILASAMSTIIPVMEKHDIKRIISLTGAGVFMKSEQRTWLDKITRILMKLTAPKILLDGETHAHILQETSLDWTIIRSPVMRESDSTAYRLRAASPKPWATIKRDSVARAIVNQVTDKSWLKKAPFIAKS